MLRLPLLHRSNHQHRVPDAFWGSANVHHDIDFETTIVVRGADERPHRLTQVEVNLWSDRNEGIVVSISLTGHPLTKTGNLDLRSTPSRIDDVDEATKVRICESLGITIEPVALVAQAFPRP